MNQDNLTEKFSGAFGITGCVRGDPPAGAVEIVDAEIRGLFKRGESLDETKDFAKQVLDRLQAIGFVELAEDQTLPEIPEFQYDLETDRPLLKRGAVNYSKLLGNFRRIKEV